MDFVVNEIFYLFWSSLSLGAFGILTTPLPNNQVVLDGTANATITCRCSKDPNDFIWSFFPVGSNQEKIIKSGGKFEDDAYDGLVVGTDGKSYALIIKTASSSTAGLYKCVEGGRWAYALLIVLGSNPSCDFTPTQTKQLPCNSTLQLSCTVSFIADTFLVTSTQLWSRKGLANPVETSSPSGIITTTTSTLNVTWPKDEGDMPIYECFPAFSLIMSKNYPGGLNKTIPRFNRSCQPFDSPNDVPCKWTKRTTLRQSTITVVTSTSTTEKGVEKAKEDSSVRLAETSNLAIQVIGVAGVLLLTQMF